MEGDTFGIHLSQLQGTTYHYVAGTYDTEPLRYTLTTPVGNVDVTSSEFWVIQSDDDWKFIPTKGAIVIDIGETDESILDNYVAHATDDDCLLLNARGQISSCDIGISEFVFTDVGLTQKKRS